MFSGEDGVQDRLRPVVLGFWNLFHFFFVGSRLSSRRKEGRASLRFSLNAARLKPVSVTFLVCHPYSLLDIVVTYTCERLFNLGIVDRKTTWR